VGATDGLLLEGREFRAWCRHYREVIGLDVVPSGVWSCSFSSSDAAALRREGHGMGRPAPVSPHVVDEWAGLEAALVRTV
jgi:hypothetical protein